MQAIRLKAFGIGEMKMGKGTMNCKDYKTKCGYYLDKDYDEKLRNKVAAFIRETRTRKSILISMVTSYGVKENMYSDAVQSHVVMDDLFA